MHIPGRLFSVVLVSGLASGCFNPEVDVPGSSGADGVGTGTTGDAQGTAMDGLPPASGTASDAADAPSTDTQGADTASADTGAGPTMTSAGVDDTTTGSGEGSDGTSTGTAVVQCDLSTHLCAPSPGGGWSAPFALGSEALGCGGAYPEELAPLFADLTAAASMCDCNCGAPSVTCPANVTVTGYSGAGCTVGVGNASVAGGQCYNQILNYTHSVSVAAAAASCGSGTVDESIPPASWDVAMLACAGVPEDGACAQDGDLCLPIPDLGIEATMCVQQAGDQVCPAGYDDKALYYDDFADTRACPASCSCSAQGASCQTSVVRFGGADCTAPQFIPNTNVTSGNSACVLTGSIESIRPGALTVNNAGSCAPGVANAQGGLAPLGQTTVCCTAP